MGDDVREAAGSRLSGWNSAFPHLQDSSALSLADVWDSVSETLSVG